MDVISKRNCRICLSQCETRDLDVIQFASKYSICTGFKITETDIPKKICSTCSIELINASNFQAKCKETERILENLMNVETEGNETEIESLLDVKLEEIVTDMKDISSSFPTSQENSIIGSFIKVMHENDDTDEYEQQFQFNCDFCEYAVSSSKRISFLKSHLTKCHEDLITEINCLECNMTFQLQSLLNFHVKEFHSENSIKDHFTCTFCSSHALRSETIHNHVISHHKEAPVFTCIICQKVFRTMDHLRLHIKQGGCGTNILADSEIDTECRIRCDFCDFHCALEANMKVHFEKMHQIEEPLRCLCDTVDIYCKDLAKEHLKYKCNIERPCNTHQPIMNLLRFKRKSKISPKIDGLTTEERKRKRQNETVECEFCHETMKKASLQRHITNIHCGVKFICPHCAKPFTLQQNLKIHIEKKHLNLQTEYPCKYCDRKFNAWASRYYHEIRIHTKNFKFSCKQCNKNFIRQAEYDDHMSMHTGSKNRQCDECYERFSTRDSLRTHKETAHRSNPMPQCHFCGMSFAREKGLQKHLKQIHEKNDRKMEVCPEMEEEEELDEYQEVEKYLVEYIQREEINKFQ